MNLINRARRRFTITEHQVVVTELEKEAKEWNPRRTQKNTTRRTNISPKEYTKMPFIGVGMTWIYDPIYSTDWS